MRIHLIAGGCVVLFAGVATAQTGFVNWESAHVHPLELTPGGGHLVAANTPDNRVEVYTIAGPSEIKHLGSVAVGLDPVSVRALDDQEVWVVNRISDSVSIVDLATLNVRATIPTGDEPGDVAFAGGRAFVSVGTDNEIWVYQLPYLATQTPTIIEIEGEDPRALATDGQTVHVAVFNAGNGTSVLNHAFVTNPDINPYEDDPNPPPNLGGGFDPPINPDLPTPPRSSMIVKIDEAGVWRDVNGADWSAGPFWSLHRHALASIDAETLDVTYATDLMTINTALDVHPDNGTVAVVGIHSLNHIRFEPNLRGRFIVSGQAHVGSDGAELSDLNPHFSDIFPDPKGVNGFDGAPIEPLPPGQKQQTIGDPRGVAWSPDGSFKIITGRGSNNIVITNASGARIGHRAVGQGPTGVAIHPAHPRAFVLNRFDATISVLSTESFEPIDALQLAMHDPTPLAIRLGRPHFYDTIKSSGLGHASCQSCHIDGANDLLAWDLGDPSGDVKEFNQVCIGNPDPCDNTDWHPMKGPMTTQTLFGIVGTEPFHWRGDREDLAAFNPAFESLLDAPQLSDEQMQQFEGFVATLTYPPNPYRNIDGSLKSSLFNGGNPQQGEFLFVTPPAQGNGGGDVTPIETAMGHVMLLDDPVEGGVAGAGGFGCAGCHALPTGTNSQILRTFIADSFTGLHHLTKVAQLRDAYRKDGFDAFAGVPQSRGTGFLHDGSFDTLQNFLLLFFNMQEQDRLDIEAFIFSMGTDTLAGVGTQLTNDGLDDLPSLVLREQLVALAESGDAGLVLKGVIDGSPRGCYYLGGGLYQSDRIDEVLTQEEIDALAAPGAEQTYTLVPIGTEVRIGVDRDTDGYFDQDERDFCTDPANPLDNPATTNHPDPCCPADVNGDTKVDVDDLVDVILNWGACDTDPCPWDVNDDLKVDVDDLVAVILTWGACTD